MIKRRDNTVEEPKQEISNDDISFKRFSISQERLKITKGDSRLNSPKPKKVSFSDQRKVKEQKKKKNESPKKIYNRVPRKEKPWYMLSVNDLVEIHDAFNTSPKKFHHLSNKESSTSIRKNKSINDTFPKSIQLKKEETVSVADSNKERVSVDDFKDIRIRRMRKSEMQQEINKIDKEIEEKEKIISKQLYLIKEKVKKITESDEKLSELRNKADTIITKANYSVQYLKEKRMQYLHTDKMRQRVKKWENSVRANQINKIMHKQKEVFKFEEKLKYENRLKQVRWMVWRGLKRFARKILKMKRSNDNLLEI